MDTASADVDEEGYLIEPEDWSEDLARNLAEREGLELSGAHWEALCFMRAYYAEHRVAPDARFVIQHLSRKLQGDRNLLFRLFPYGYVRQACKIAGMKRPRAWSTG